MDANTATELFNLMEKFAGYGFNKSHSAAYAVVAYQTAYFKAHYPAAFMAANLSTVMDDTDKVKDLIEDCKALGLTILAPDINACNWRFEPVDAKTIRYGLGAHQGDGAGRDRGDPGGARCRRAVRGSLRPRARGSTSMSSTGGSSRRSCAPARLTCCSTIAPRCWRRWAARSRRPTARAACVGQASLFGGGEASARHVDYVKAPRWSKREKLSNEKLALGYYFSGHLFREYAAEARRLAPTPLAEVRQAREQVKLTGVIVVGAQPEHASRPHGGRRARRCARRSSN